MWVQIDRNGIWYDGEKMTREATERCLDQFNASEQIRLEPVYKSARRRIWITVVILLVLLAYALGVLWYGSSGDPQKSTLSTGFFNNYPRSVKNLGCQPADPSVFPLLQKTVHRRFHNSTVG